MSTSSVEDLEEQREEKILQPIPPNLSEGRKNLRKWLAKAFRVKITDGRILIGYFNCTDKDANIVLLMCTEYLEDGKDSRFLGSVMIPGKHIVSLEVDTLNDPRVLIS